jgi:Asp-tRNA(Asn)/Glu-tRNA(Gln) amidotransferase A subunit family amidase
MDGMEGQTMSVYDRDWTREDARRRAALPEPRSESDIETNDLRQAPLAECHALERRWAELHEAALQLNQEWQNLVSIIISRVETNRNGQSLNWTDGAAAFYDLDKHAARTSHLAQEAVQTCHQYALALQRALDAMT